MLFLGLNGRPGTISRDVRGNARFSAHAAGLRRGRSLRQIRPHLRCTSCSSAPLRSNTSDNKFLHERNNGAHAPHGWHCLQSPRSWKMLEEDSMFRMQLPEQLTPTWKMLLLSDGSVTRHLQLLTGQHIDVDCLEMESIGNNLEGLPEGSEAIEGPRVQRQVLLRLPLEAENGAGPKKGQALVYATSWWNEDTVNEYLHDKQLPIWASLSAARTELYRDVQALYHGTSVFLEREFGETGPFWGRQYFFWHNDKPLTLIYEVFSPALQRLLGPALLQR